MEDNTGDNVRKRSETRVGMAATDDYRHRQLGNATLVCAMVGEFNVFPGRRGSAGESPSSRERKFE